MKRAKISDDGKSILYCNTFTCRWAARPLRLSFVFNHDLDTLSVPPGLTVYTQKPQGDARLADCPSRATYSTHTGWLAAARALRLLQRSPVHEATNCLESWLPSTREAKEKKKAARSISVLSLAQACNRKKIGWIWSSVGGVFCIKIPRFFHHRTTVLSR